MRWKSCVMSHARLMLIAIILFGVLPGMVALGVIMVSVRSIVRAVSVAQLILGLPTITVAVWSLLILERIFLDAAWPTYLPHIAIAAISPLAAIQWHLARGKGSDVDERRLFIIGLVLLAVSVPPSAFMAREIAMSNIAARRYSAEHIQSREPGMAGGALTAEIGGHVVALEDAQPVDTNGDLRVDGIVRILIDGRDYSTDSRAEIRLNSRDANRYWGYVYLMRLIDRDEGTQQLVVAQNLLNGRFRTLTVSANGSVLQDEFGYEERCDPPVRALLIDSVVPSPSGLCSAGQQGWVAVVYPVIYPWVSCALGLGCLVDAGLAQRRRARMADTMRPS
jgi:hypothetical protein